MTERPRGRELYLDIGSDTLVRARAVALLLGMDLVDSSNPIPVLLVNPAGGQELLVDDITGALATISTPHHEVHEGETFQSSYKSPDANPIADDASIDILLQTGGTEYGHLTFDIASGGTAEILLYEDTIVNNVGTALAENNMKRYSANVATTTATHTPTVANVGTLLHNSLLPGGAGPGQNRTGGTVRVDTEWPLRLNTNYLIRGINRAGNAQPMSNVVQWYEESTP